MVFPGCSVGTFTLPGFWVTVGGKLNFKTSVSSASSQFSKKQSLEASIVSPLRSPFSPVVGSANWSSTSSGRSPPSMTTWSGVTVSDSRSPWGCAIFLVECARFLLDGWCDVNAVLWLMAGAWRETAEGRMIWDLPLWTSSTICLIFSDGIVKPT